jgi:hypothetical protein
MDNQEIREMLNNAPVGSKAFFSSSTTWLTDEKLL